MHAGETEAGPGPHRRGEIGEGPTPRRAADQEPRGRPVERVSDAALRAAGWTVCALCLLTMIAAGILLAVRRPAGPEAWASALADTAALLGVPVVGGLIVARLPRQAYGWVWLSLGVCVAAIQPAVVDEALPSAVRPAGWVSELLVGYAFVGFLACVTLVLLLFPNSRPPSPRWAWVQRATLWTAAVLAVTIPFTPPTAELSQPAPYPGSEALGTVGQALLYAGVGLLFALLLVSTAAVPVRWRRAEPAERRQLKWFALGAAWFAPGLVVTAWLPVPSWLEGLVFFTMFVALEVAVGIAMLRHRLYDVDRVINRALLYGALSACLVAVYVTVIVATSLVSASHSDGLGPALATAAVAILVLPAHARLQRAVNQLTFGERGDPYRVLSDLGQRLESAATNDSVLPQIVESVAMTLRLPYVSIELDRGDAAVRGAAYGRPVATPVGFPLTLHGERLGRLLASPRSTREDLTTTDRRLLADLARHAAVAAHAFLLSDDLRRSRARVLAAREEERRRLRRDLHDGLGPTLAAVALGMDTVRRRLDQPQEAAARLERLSGEVQAAIEEIRRLVHDLRPPALDQYGLVDAIRADARRLEIEAGATSHAGLTIRVEAPPSAPPLPAAVEVAAYRIVGEALTNVVRHADARDCVVRLDFDESVDLEITDNGRGLPDRRHEGVGLHSMCERAVEIGGRCEIRTTERGGTQVRARLPLGASS